jgi:hypothetical protein
MREQSKSQNTQIASRLSILGTCGKVGFKILTVLTLDGLSHVYGPISARSNDVGMVNISGLNRYLYHLQHDCFVATAGDEIIYSAFGDGIFNMGLWCIVLHFCAFGGFDLTLEQLLCNRHYVNSAQILIKHNYTLMSNLFCICANKEWNRMANKAPYAFEQLRVSHLMVNCYV